LLLSLQSSKFGEANHNQRYFLKDVESVFLWGLYALRINYWPLLMTEIITGVMTGYILMIKLKGFKDEQLDRKRN